MLDIVAVLDPALHTLRWAFEQSELGAASPQKVLFLSARCTADLSPWPAWSMTCVQGFYPHALGLQNAGYTVVADLDLISQRNAYDFVLLLPGRQRDHNRGLLAAAVHLVKPAGHLLISVANNEGAGAMQRDCAQLLGLVQSMSKNKCRALWAQVGQAAKQSILCRQWAALLEPRYQADSQLYLQPGVFNNGALDIGSALLIDCFDSMLRGSVADLGAGSGVLAKALLERSPEIEAIDLYEADHAALKLAKANLRKYTKPINYYWTDITTAGNGKYDLVISNPPFHAGRADEPELGRQFIRVAAQMLKSGGQLLLVANRHLPYESVLNECFDELVQLKNQHGYKVFRARQPKPLCGKR